LIINNIGNLFDLKTGIPTRERLESLGLKYIVDELEAHGPYLDRDGPLIWKQLKLTQNE